ncbi:YtxH domain-containing protein [Nostocoides sp. HKS02]|uniref:YtxH domain-containing protein n=1 Tax=Nostocoides sp. HKS02 TaxID=1813880 RepID=UPI0012B44E65|nr:YtxH domain-containing protein [Tetrasphaera sp. HKS02]QGN57841.1 hypothetical protein GKE56_08065 [Tetrasphaera sp. HKS02]
MVVLIIGMLICVGLAVAVVAVVAVPARREGRELLTPQGEEIVAIVKEKTESTLDKTGEAISTAKDKVSDTVSNPFSDNADDTPRHRAS